MTLSEIKTAVESGKIVHWSSTYYTVIKDKIGQWLIKCDNGHCIGLTWTDEVTMNGKEEDFFIVPEKEEKMQPIVELDKEETFISSVSTDNTGGHIYNDVIILKSGIRIQISEESICIYGNEEMQEVSNYIVAIANSFSNTKKFSYKDKTGRGITNRFNLSQIIGLDNEENWDGDKLHNWAMECSEGDEWENQEMKFICTKY